MTTLEIDLNPGHLWSVADGTFFADRPYVYTLTGAPDGGAQFDDVLTDRRVVCAGADRIVTGRFARLGLELRQVFRNVAGALEETVSLSNPSDRMVRLSDIGLGFCAALEDRGDWRLCAVPFRVQLDGSRHDYSVEDLAAGRFSNAVYSDKDRSEPGLREHGRLRSEAWAWWCGDAGLLIAKYNPDDIELCVAAPIESQGSTCLRFGGVGACLYGEPSRLHMLEPGATVTFGTTVYRPLGGPIECAFTAYREELDRRGHGFPSDYDPPVNWNELYDVGWYHSDSQKLTAGYTREALLQEAGKARDCGCDLLYLDPGWETAEGLTTWDQERLGKLPEFRAMLKRDYQLQLGLRTVLRCNGPAALNHWDDEHLVRHAEGTRTATSDVFDDMPFKEYCICSRDFWRQKLERIDAIIRQGVSFLMVDEMDWRGPCDDSAHGHPVPAMPDDHLRAVYALCRELRRRNPGLAIACHDPIWPWHTSIYAPTYFEQGFDGGAYQENWGFEYMWDCLDDLKSGKALALYYYNLACNIPLYLHITMAGDNDHCVFFWWAASTVRHLGIGGKHGHPSVTPKDTPPHDPQQRFAAYREQMARYRRLKAWFVRGTFHGLAEHLHLHTLPGHNGGVLVIFNLTNQEREIVADVPTGLLGATEPVSVDNGSWAQSDQALTVRVQLPPMAPAVVAIGAAALSVQES